MALRVVDKGSHDDTWADFVRPWDRDREVQTPIFARSDAYYVLLRELRRYLAHQVRGRSFLIAGHRGSGKTSLVLRAIQDLSASNDDGIRQRPLLVKLHGPGLLAAADSLSGDGHDPAGEKGERKRGKKKKEKTRKGVRQGGTPRLTSPAQAVLVQLTIALYRALCAEVARCYRDTAFHRIDSGGETDLVELAAQVRLELDNGPGAAELRDFWARVDALRSGVLWPRVQPGPTRAGFWRGLRVVPLGTAPWTQRTGLGRDQGMRELVAIATAAQAFQVVSGSITYKQEQKDSSALDTSLKAEARPAAKEIVEALLGFVSGGLVGGVAFVAEELGIVASAALGLTTALATSLGLSWSTTRTRRQSLSREHTFIRDRSVATLDRELPNVIERIRAAGLAPVFVVDELDKVDDLVTRMGHLVHRLKHLVADYSLFCFLTDRDYFEHLYDLTQNVAYPKEHTYFSHRLFVLYRPRDLHAYLDELLRLDRSRDARDESGKFALSYLLLHRAMLHVFDLQRELAKVCDDEGRVKLSTGQLRTGLGYRFHIMIQLAIEHLLEEEELRQRLDQDPQFGQKVYDALYMPSRRWLSGHRDLDLSDTAIERCLLARLRPRASILEPPRAAEQSGGDAAVASAGATAAPAQDRETPGERAANDGTDGADSGGETETGWARETDRQYLFDLVRRLVGLLTNPEQLVTALSVDHEAKDSRLAVLIDMIPRAVGPSGSGQGSGGRPLLQDLGDDRFRWCRDPFGRELLGPEGREEDLVDVSRQEQDEAVIQLAAAQLEELGGEGFDLAALAEMGVLRRSPDHHEVMTAAERLRGYRRTRQLYEDLLADQDTLHEYAQMLVESSPVLAKAVVVGRHIGEEADLAGAEERTSRGVEGLSSLLDLPTLPPEAVSHAIDSFASGFFTGMEDAPPLSVEQKEAWTTWVLEKAPSKAKKRQKVPLVAHREAAWRHWAKRVAAFVETGTDSPEPGLAEAVCLAARVKPPVAFVRPLERLSIKDASETFWSAIKDDAVESASHAPLWASAPSLYLLGLGGLISAVLVQLGMLVRAGHYSVRPAKAELDAGTELEVWPAIIEKAQTSELPPSALILLGGAEGPWRGWKPHSSHGALMATPEDLKARDARALLANARGFEGDQGALTVVMVEVPEAVEGQSEAGPPGIASPFSRLPVVYLATKPLSQGWAEGRTVLNPLSLEAAMDEAGKLLRTS